MTLDIFLRMLQSHLAALRSSQWPRPHGSSNGHAFFLDEDDTLELIAELTRVRDTIVVSKPERAITPGAGDAAADASRGARGSGVRR